MDTWLLFALVGLSAGAIYAALGLGLVVVYKGTGVVNFATGAMAMWGAYVYTELRTTGDLVLPVVGVPDRIHLSDQVPFTVAFVTGLVASAAVGLAVHLLVFRPLRQAPVLAKVVASVGVMIVFQAMVSLKFGSQARAPQPILPTEPIAILGVDVGRDRVLMAATTVVIAIGLTVWFRRSRLGLSVVAAAENQRGATLAGYSPQRLAAVSWVLAGTVTGGMVILTSPTTTLNPSNYTLFVVPALAASLVGRLTSLSWTVGAGLGLGVLQSLTTHAKTQSWFPEIGQQGVAESLPFLIVVAALFLVGHRLPQRDDAGADPLPPVIIPRHRPAAVGLLVATGAAAVVLTSGSVRFAIVTSLIITVIALSLVLLTGLVGQISLAQAAFAGAAGFALSKIGDGIPFPFSLLLAASVSAVLGVLVGIPALRIRGVQLAVVTLAAGITIEQLVFRNPRIASTTGNPIPDPSLFGIDLGVRDGTNVARVEFGLLVLVVLTICALAVGNLLRSSTGRRFLAVRSNERAGLSLGVDAARTKLVAFALSSFLAGIGGCLLGYSRGQLSPDSFGVFVGLSLLAFAYLGGITSISGALLAGTFAPLGISYLMFDRLISGRVEAIDELYFLLGGVGLILAAIFNPLGIAGAMRDQRAERARRRTRARPPVDEPTPADARTGRAEDWAPRRDGLAFAARGVRVRHGGLVAVDGLDVDVAPGEIVGLIGPNGAGKTTFLDGITGFVPAEGTVTLGDVDLSRRAPHLRARAGVARTWQSLELFDELTVRENVQVGAAPGRARDVLLDLCAPGRRRPDDHIDATLDLLGLTDVADAHPSELPLGRQKLVGVARSLGAGGAVLLLDEPAAGLETSESLALGATLRTVADAGIGILLIDHDMSLVLGTCDRIQVIELGRPIAAGRPAAVRDDPAVIAAYLGGAVVEGAVR